MLLRAGEKSPIAPESDEEGAAADSAKEDRHGAASPTKPAAPLRIELAGLADRIVELPIAAGRIDGLRAFDDALLYVAVTDPSPDGNDDESVGELHAYDLDSRKDALVIGELGTSHTYVGGGDMPDVPKVDVGLLGADFSLDPKTGRYRFERIYRDRDWDSKVAPPLADPGVVVREGDWLLAVDGVPLRAPNNLYAAFTGTKGRQTRITIGSSPEDAKPRDVTVTPIGDEASLRYQAWVRTNRERVAKATGGRIAYVHVPDTSLEGIKEFTKQFFPQVDRQGIIVDERFNSGGWPPDFFIERLARSTWVYWAVRDAADDRTPTTAIDGPKCMLVNEYAGSGGDAFPYYFRMQKLGPVIGTRTWGGLVGLDEDIPLVDGGYVTMPDAGMWD